jgi:hypothetical protein
MCRACSTNGAEEKCQNERHVRRKWVIILKRILERWGGMDWINLAQGRDNWTAVVNTVMNLRVPQNDGKFSSCCTTGSLSRRAQLHGVRWLIIDEFLRTVCASQ